MGAMESGSKPRAEMFGHKMLMSTVVKGDLFGYLSAMGIDRRATAQWMDAMLKTSLVLNYDPTCVDEATATQLEISPSGELHLYWGLGNYDYIVAMAETTPVLDANAYSAIENASRGQERYRDRDIISCFGDYLRREDQAYRFVPDHESYKGQRDLAYKLAASKGDQPS
jgi:hypothetical protein